MKHFHLDSHSFAQPCHSSWHLSRSVRDERFEQHSVACRTQQKYSVQQTWAARRDASSEGVSTSGQTVSEVPNIIYSLIQSLPAHSKRRKLLLATSSLTSAVGGWKLESRYLYIAKANHRGSCTTIMACKVKACITPMKEPCIDRRVFFWQGTGPRWSQSPTTESSDSLSPSCWGLE